MRIAVIGAGGVGGYFGGRLAAGGNAVGFVVRGNQRAAMASDGLRLLSPVGDAHIAPVHVIDDGDGAPWDAVIVTVKYYDLAEAAGAIAPLLGPETIVVPIENGIDAEPLLADRLGAGHVVGGYCEISSHIDAPGVIRHGTEYARLIAGALDGSVTPRLEAFVKACDVAGIQARLSDDIARDKWDKFSLLVTLAGSCGLYRLPLGEVRTDPGRRAFAADLLGEAVAVARASGVAIHDDQEDRVWARFDGMPAGVKPSMLVDLEAGRRLELPWINGAIARLGDERGIDTPAHDRVCAELAAFVDGA
jgi:2-dehydropantoate 2-reductase